MARKRSTPIKTPESKPKRAKATKAATAFGGDSAATINPHSLDVNDQYQTPSDGLSDADGLPSDTTPGTGITDASVLNHPDNRKRSRMVQAWSEPEIELVLECVQRLHDKSKRVFKISMFEQIAPMFEDKFDVAVHGKQLQSMFKTVRKCHRYFSSLLQRDGVEFDSDRIIMKCSRAFYDSTIKNEVRVMPYITVNILDTEVELAFAHFIIMQDINPAEDSNEFPDISYAVKRRTTEKETAVAITAPPRAPAPKIPSAIAAPPSPGSNKGDDDSEELASNNGLADFTNGNNKRPKYGVKKVLKKRAKITKDLLDVVHRLEHLDDTRDDQNEVVELLAAVVESNKVQAAAIDALSARFDRIEAALAQLVDGGRKKKTKSTATATVTATA
ncbi:hypothetical protein DV451_001074 [Geotrichum candidum]|uniref:Myb/SANT-like domain-containing protein n=1 Tax=Geotrichum candidum TaxID=1173061 RepID=A0A9P5G8E0_GEOCN|nr:hypothetical protein DV451_001074 [Geotrichum candidum]KAF5108405.1 hypothetical protein DV453_002365 [Geotrichum candidum]